ncbi:hypothetical protein JOE21_002037 [Desmospora profundinema]|uniref:Uncharacterized protein n=1 Tax=Desmospora profundinema TaxID=1571184 RepID=A0ABU1IMN9_9BACL|nr:hypothetical protein [Desmospora profundinema]
MVESLCTHRAQVSPYGWIRQALIARGHEWMRDSGKWKIEMDKKQTEVANI